ncbi:hypothetical protein MAPG_07846 [Magnaporthiopsis poae ATCC 64411]|uniref:Uncharacterized protein n=1 Tax=Magnaporthiopsis poae (strain ATCC 64411 / 73-15) TaxID=644358 RepID=A0A0C4E5S2_MAGP6|nr:hypothetical protein MAPG_07846 [Magnaporthiopsis poae ATCC 64411]
MDGRPSIHHHHRPLSPFPFGFGLHFPLGAVMSHPHPQKASPSKNHTTGRSMARAGAFSHLPTDGQAFGSHGSCPPRAILRRQEQDRWREGEKRFPDLRGGRAE